MEKQSLLPNTTEPICKCGHHYNYHQKQDDIELGCFAIVLNGDDCHCQQFSKRQQPAAETK